MPLKARHEDAGVSQFMQKISLFGALAVIGFIVYINSLKGPFVLDDLVYIVENQRITSLANFVAPYGARYVADLSFALNYAASGLTPFDFRLTNIIIHIVNACLVFTLVKAVLSAPALASSNGTVEGGISWKIPALTAFIFLLHPVNTQAVSYIAQRYTSLSALLYLCAVIFYLKSRASVRTNGAVFHYLGSIAMTVLAMKTKESAFTIPVTLALIDLAFYEDKAKNRVYRLIPFFMTLFLIPAELFMPGLFAGSSNHGSTELMHRLKIKDITTLSPYQYLITQFRVAVTYLRLLVYPAGLRFDYGLTPYKSMLDSRVLSSLIFVLFIVASAVYMFARTTCSRNTCGVIISCGVFWFFITLSVESSVIPIKDVIFEHRLYLPGAGLMASFSASVFYLSGKAKKACGSVISYAAAVFIGAILITLGFTTYSRNEVWSNDLLLYRDEVAKGPGQASPHNYLGLAYYRRGMFDDAAAEFRRAVSIDPAFAAAHKNLALGLAAKNDIDGAIAEFTIVEKLVPDYAGSYYNIGLLYLKKGAGAAAAQAFREALRLDPSLADARRLLKDLN